MRPPDRPAGRKDARIENELRRAHLLSAEPKRCSLARHQSDLRSSDSCHAVAGVDWVDELHRIECPTLVLAGAHDVGAPPAMARAIHERIRASRMEVFEHASHLSPVEQPEAFRQSMDHFIESVDLGQDIRP